MRVCVGSITCKGLFMAPTNNNPRTVPVQVPPSAEAGIPTRTEGKGQPREGLSRVNQLAGGQGGIGPAPGPAGPQEATFRQAGDPGRAALQAAAGLAAYWSKARGAKTVPVNYTEIRHVSKPRGAAPGLVTIRNEKTLFVSPHEIPRADEVAE